MFDKDVRTEAIPERIFELARIVELYASNEKALSKEELKGLFIQEELCTGTTNYFTPVFEAGQELGIISLEDNIVKFTGKKELLKSLMQFRKFCNMTLFNNKESQFYQLIACFLNANDEWFKYGSFTTSDEIQKILNQATGIPTLTLKKDVVLAIRFWISFLGFGYVQEKQKIFLPNMYTALKDFIVSGNIETKKEYSVREFFRNVHQGIQVALGNSVQTMKLNLALSNALRLLHDEKEIILKNNLDSEEVWHLFPNEEHIFTSDITHIIVLEVK